MAAGDEDILFRVTGKTDVAIAVQGSGLVPYAWACRIMFEIEPPEALSNAIQWGPFSGYGPGAGGQL